MFGGPLASTGWVARPVGVSVGRLMDWLAGFMVCGWVAVAVAVTVTVTVTVTAMLLAMAGVSRVVVMVVVVVVL